MISLLTILKEIRVSKSVPNNLNKLLFLQSQIQNSNNPKVKRELVLKCLELILPIWNFYYPNDKKIRNCIEVIKKFLKGEASVEEVRKIPDTINVSRATDTSYATHYIANAAHYATYAFDATYTINVASAAVTDYAIKATKSFFKIDENLKEIKAFKTPILNWNNANWVRLESIGGIRQDFLNVGEYYSYISKSTSSEDNSIVILLKKQYLEKREWRILHSMGHASPQEIKSFQDLINQGKFKIRS